MDMIYENPDVLADPARDTRWPIPDTENKPVKDAVFIVNIVDPERFDRVVAEAKAANAHMSEQEMNDIIDEAVQWARSADARHY